MTPKVHRIEISREGEFLDFVLDSLSSKASDDETLCVHYPPLQELKKPARVGIIARPELDELQRLVPNVDLVSYNVDASYHNGGKRKSREVVSSTIFIRNTCMRDGTNSTYGCVLHHTQISYLSTDL